MIVSDGRRLSRFGSCPFGVCAGGAFGDEKADLQACIDAIDPDLVGPAALAALEACRKKFPGVIGGKTAAPSAAGGKPWSAYTDSELLKALSYSYPGYPAGSLGIILAQARAGTAQAVEMVAAAVARFYGAPAAPGGGDGAPGEGSLQAAVDAANKVCAAIPVEGLRTKCYAEVEANKAKGAAAVQGLIDKYTGGGGGGGGGDGGGLPGEEGTGFPWWGYVLVAALAAKVAKVW